jgi:hypothetical protein
MLRRRWFLLFGAVAVLFLVLGGCKTEADGPSAPPPPPAAELPPLDEGVTFPAGPAGDNKEAFDLVNEGTALVMQSLSGVFDEIFTDLFGDLFGSDEDPSYSLARASDPLSINEQINKTIPGVLKVTGSVNGAVTSSLPEEGFENWTPAPGDSAAGNLDAEINLNITELKDADLTVKGKLSVNGKASGNLSLVSESNIPLTFKLEAGGSYGLTISDGSSGVRAAASLDISANINENISGYLGGEPDTDVILAKIKDLVKIEYRVILYDSNGDEQGEQTFTEKDILDNIQF